MPFLLAGFGEFSWQDSAGSLRIICGKKSDML
jgi:hypothetical protein